MTGSYDAIQVGGDHNGQVAANYLAPAAGEGAGSDIDRRSGRGFLTHLLDSGVGLRVGYQVVRNSLFRPLARYFARN